MNVLLVKPASDGDHIQPPLGLAYLAKALADCHHVTLVDEMLTGGSAQQLADRVSHDGYDIVGLQCYSHDLKAVRRHLEAIKGRCPDVKTILGGPHPTLMPEETFAVMGNLLDFVLRGEAEETLPALLERLEAAPTDLSAIPGLAYRNGDDVVVNGPPQTVKDLDNFPMPAWEHIPPNKYPPAQHGAFFKNFPVAPIMTTRGCPFRCSFCSATLLSGSRVRTRDPAGIMDEIRLLYHEYGVREIHIIDDNFSLNKEHARAVLEGICNLDIELSIAFPNGLKVETITPDLLKLMRKAGVYLLSLGIESGSDRTLKRVNKNLTVDLIREKCRLIKDAGMDIAGFFILGLPGETVEEMQRTIEFSLELPLLRANYFTFLPLPGTDIYHQLQEEGKLSSVDWKQFSFTTAPDLPDGITRSELRSLQRRAFVRFYFLRPSIFLKNLLLIRSPRHFYHLSRRLYRWLLS